LPFYFLFFIFRFSFFIFHLKSEAQIIHVPADYPSIQEGINAANPGDTVLVADSLYYENINFLGKKPLMVASHFLIDGDTNHINNTIINGSQPDDPNLGSVVIMGNEEDTTSILCGFTITGGTGTFVAVVGNIRIGGGVNITYGGQLINNHIEYNILENDLWTAGGGVWIGGPASVPLYCILRGNRIAHNKAESINDEGDGGGVACFWNLTMEDNEIINNEASGPYRGDGGGVYIHGDWGHIDLVIRNNSIKYNKATSNSGMTDVVLAGGIDIFNDCAGIVSNNDISFNTIEVRPGQQSYGTGIMIEMIPTTDFIVENNFITNNTSNGTYCMGGGVLIYDCLCNFRNNVVQNNTGTHGGGVAVGFNIDKQAIIINNTITGNNGAYGGGLYAASADAVVINTIIWGNTADSSGLSIYEDNCTIPVRYSDVEGDDYWPGDGNEIYDPGFGGDGYHLSDNSLLWDEGKAAVIINGITYECPEYDYDGEPRPWWNTDPEIGADEIPSDVSVEELPVLSRQSSVTCFPNLTTGPTEFLISNFNFPKITLKVYDAHGQEVATVLDGKWPGDQVVRWDASNLPAGVYYYRLTTDDPSPAAGGLRTGRRLATGKIVKY
jgi:hypothetical protein